MYLDTITYLFQGIDYYLLRTDSESYIPYIETLYPIDFDTVNSINIPFQWRSYVPLEEYILQYADNPSFDYPTSITIADTAMFIDSTITISTEQDSIYWRVKGISEFYDMDYSVARLLYINRTKISEKDSVSIIPTISIYPTPFNSSLTIDLPFTADLTVYDINGRKVFYRENVKKGRFIFETKDLTDIQLPSGIYFISISNDNKIYNRKVIFLK